LHDLVPEEAPPDLLDTLVQAEEVSSALAGLNHEATALAFGPDMDKTAREMERLQPDVVFNLVEAPWGLGRLIHLGPALIECLGLPCAGCSARALRLTSNKPKAKELMRAAGLPTPEWITLRDNVSTPAADDLYIIKSAWEHSSVGLDEDSLVPGDPDRLKAEMARRTDLLGGECFAEKFIEGREFNLSLLVGPDGPEVLPPAEIIFEDYGPDKIRVVDYRAKWQADSFEFSHTPRSFDFTEKDRELLARLSELSRRCWRVFKLGGWARVDFRVDESGQPWILEINANPCLSADAGFMAAAGRAGLDLPSVVGRILDDGLKTGRASRPKVQTV